MENKKNKPRMVKFTPQGEIKLEGKKKRKEKEEKRREKKKEGRKKEEEKKKHI